jgi:hypothetical protein
MWKLAHTGITLARICFFHTEIFCEFSVSQEQYQNVKASLAMSHNYFITDTFVGGYLINLCIRSAAESRGAAEVFSKVKLFYNYTT